MINDLPYFGLDFNFSLKSAWSYCGIFDQSAFGLNNRFALTIMYNFTFFLYTILANIFGLRLIRCMTDFFKALLALNFISIQIIIYFFKVWDESSVQMKLSCEESTKNFHFYSTRKSNAHHMGHISKENWSSKRKIVSCLKN